MRRIKTEQLDDSVDYVDAQLYLLHLTDNLPILQFYDLIVLKCAKEFNNSTLDLTTSFF